MDRIIKLREDHKSLIIYVVDIDDLIPEDEIEHWINSNMDLPDEF